MSETKTVYATTDPDHLTAEQIELLRFVLGVLSLAELVQITVAIKHVFKQPGFGEILIAIENSHIRTVQGAQRLKVQPNLEADELRHLME